MSGKTIKDRLDEYIRRKYEIDDSDLEFTHDVHLFDYGYIDSFGAVELIGFVESEFGVVITNQHLITRSLNTISEIASFIHEHADAEG